MPEVAVIYPYETGARWRSTSHLPRNRRAFDLALRCQGARTAVQSGVRLDNESTDTERVVAATFSSTIWEYSAGEHLPRAIICPRRPIVSQDANAISIIIKGNGTDFLRRRFLMVRRWEPTVGVARSVASSRRTATRWHRRTPGPHIGFICLRLLTHPHTRKVTRLCCTLIGDEP